MTVPFDYTAELVRDLGAPRDAPVWLIRVRYTPPRESGGRRPRAHSFVLYPPLGVPLDTVGRLVEEAIMADYRDQVAS